MLDRPANEFKSLAYGWPLLGLRLLRLCWERCRAVAETEADHAVLREMVAQYHDEMSRDVSMRERLGRDTTTQRAVLTTGQHVERFFGPLLFGRFRVMETLKPGQFFLVDYRLPDLLVGGSEGKRYSSPVEAAKALNALNIQETEMETKPRLNLPATGKSNPAIAAKFPPIDGGKGKAKAAVPAAAKPSEAKPDTKPAGDKPESAGAMFKRLIMEGKLTDDAIFTQVQAAHNLDDKKRSYVAWYRNDLAKNGKSPPPPVGGVAPKLTPEERVAKMRDGKAAKAAEKTQAKATPVAKPDPVKAAPAVARGKKTAPVPPAVAATNKVINKAKEQALAQRKAARA